MGTEPEVRQQKAGNHNNRHWFAWKAAWAHAGQSGTWAFRSCRFRSIRRDQDSLVLNRCHVMVESGKNNVGKSSLLVPEAHKNVWRDVCGSRATQEICQDHSKWDQYLSAVGKRSNVYKYVSSFLKAENVCIICLRDHA